MVKSIAVSLNRPRFCSSATWSSSAITFADNSTVGDVPNAIFVNTNDSVIALNTQSRLIIIWLNGTNNSKVQNITGSTNPRSLFIGANNALYVNNDNKGVSRWIENISENLLTGEVCFDLFIDDTNNSLYCSLKFQHKVIKRSLNSSDDQVLIVAGTGCPGFISNMLNLPHGIFVDENFNLYIADSLNNRIQMFYSGQLNGITVVGKDAPGTIILNNPSDIVLDADRNIFIVDTSNDRIVGSTSTGFQCIVGCLGYGTDDKHLAYPLSMAFDSAGNIFVVDHSNSRIQKFFLSSNSCDATTVAWQGTLTSTINTVQTTAASSLGSQQLNKSYNRPKFNTYTSWNPAATTFADTSTIGKNPYAFFIDINNTMYIPSRSNNKILIWFTGASNPSQTLSTNSSNSSSIFVTSSRDIYVDNGILAGEIDRWTFNWTKSTSPMSIQQFCTGLFVDINNTLYCSLESNHQVIAKSLSISNSNARAVAGTGCSGSNLDMLASPNGIFIDDNFDLYVADSGNNRIQKFQPGQVNGSTVAGSGITNTIDLNYPTCVVLDANKYLFIVDSNNHRIVGSGPNGFRCIIACSSISGAQNYTLSYPRSMTFDSYGNIYVSDTGNNRIQKFNMTSNSTVLPYNRPKLGASATWNVNATTFANSSTVGQQPYGIFVTSTDNVYAVARNLRNIAVWNNGSSIPTVNISDVDNNTLSIFVPYDYYAIVGSASCSGVFLDINSVPYCSVQQNHRVLRSVVIGNSTSWTIIAGTGTSGAAANMLSGPQGIFIDINADLYVADCGNNRIQLFHFQQSNGTTVVGSGALTLDCPSNVILDAEGYLYVTDTNNNRIIQSRYNESQCIVGCTNNAGSATYELNHPQTIGFDSSGNLFVMDKDNSRIQKFFLATNSSSQTTTTSTTSITTTTTTTSTTSITTTTTTTTTNITTATTSITTTYSANTTGVSNVSSNQSCSPPVITITRNNSSLTSPLKFRRGQSFSIVSSFELNCDSSLATTAKWTIYSCTSNCSLQILLNQSIITTSSELFIPAKTLDYGTYQLILTVFMTIAPHLSSSISTYVQIISSDIIVSLIPRGTSMITYGYQQNLLLDPGTYSIDPDGDIFNASNWIYKYYCRLYNPQYDFPNNGGNLLTIEDPTIDLRNPSCISNSTNKSTTLIFGGTNTANRSSLTIMATSLASNQTYQFMVQMSNRQNSTIQLTGYLLVQIENIETPMIIIGCTISTLCQINSNVDYQLINPTTQLALFSVCNSVCSSANNIAWKIYYGVTNTSTNQLQWISFDQMNNYRNLWFFGTNTANFTSTNDLLLWNSSIEYWRFQVIYSFTTGITSSALNFKINRPPSNGSCSITPSNGTTSTLFTITCSNWQDSDDIQDYSFYGWTSNSTQRVLLAFSPSSTIQLRLPTGDDHTSFLFIVGAVRDTLDCITEFNISFVSVVSDSKEIDELMDDPSNTSSAVLHRLASGNQNTIGQTLYSVAKELNKINDQITNLSSSGISSIQILVSSFSSQTQQTSSELMNTSVLNEYTKQLNTYSNIRDYLITYTSNLMMSTIDNIILQATSLAQLTQATNQITRSAANLASDICYKLAESLQSMSKRISYEQTRTAATLIAQCASNALNAINGPLQQRTIVLDLDTSRANSLPADYDTDLESEWSNLNLFADGNDFSWSTIEKGRNIYYQNQMANQISSQTDQTLSLLTSALNIHLNLGQSLIMNTSSLYMSFETIDTQSLSNKLIKQIENAEIQLPSNLQFNSITNSSTLRARSIVQPLASMGNLKSESNTNLSRSVSFSLFDQFENEIPLQVNSLQPIELIIPRDRNLIIPSMSLQNVTQSNSTQHNQIFNLHFINITNSLPVSVHFEIEPLVENMSYLFIYKFDSAPILNSSTSEIDGWTLLCFNYIYFINNEKTIGHQSIIFGLRELNSTETLNFCSNSSNMTLPITNKSFNFTVDYKLRVYTSGCYYLDANNQWKSDGLTVGSLTNHYQTQCFSTHLTTFAGGFIVLPAPINWNYVFSNADFLRNKTIYITLICVCTLYILLMIFARRQDRKDAQKLGVTPLVDNQNSDRYLYQILVFTGHRKDAGTKSKVHFILAGDHGETRVRTLSDSRRDILQRGDIDAFLMAVPKSLGPLNYIHIWHDNTGSNQSASWFLKYILVRDLQTMEKSYFLCQKWFAVEKQDGLIERVLPVADDSEKRQFSYLFSKQAYHNLSEGHLWFSIFSRPPSDRFTRVQRCTCCFVLFLTSMLLNILYYDQSTETQTNTSHSLTFGPLYVTPEQISIGVIVEILSFVPSILLIQLFRRSKSAKTKSTSFLFPWWCIFIAYGLSFLFAVVSIFFIIVRGIEFGDLKSQKWLTSLLTGFFSSVLLIQPLKVIGLAIFFAFFCRNSDVDQQEAEFIDDEIHPTKTPIISPFHQRFNRLDKEEIRWAREQRLKEIEMWSIIREIGSYLIFLSFLYFITFSNTNSNAFYQVQHLRNFFLNTKQNENSFTKISTVDQYWLWLETSFTENLRAQQWYNDEPPRNLSGYINDKTNRLIGWAIIRQLRVQSHSCQIKSSVNNLFSACYDEFSFLNEEKRSFEPEWVNQTMQISNQSIARAFQYQSTDRLQGYVYEFRGRLEYLKSNLTELRRLNWIDSQTRIMIIQLNLYNPNSQLFTAIVLRANFLPTGGIKTQSQFQPISFTIFKSISQLICLIIYMLFIGHMTFVEFNLVFKLKRTYFSNFWSLINLCIITFSWSILSIYIWRYRESSRIGDLFSQTHGYVYIDLQTAVYINDLYIDFLGLNCFFGTIKLVRLCRFNSRLLLFIQTLDRARNDLLSFALMFSIVYIAFTALFYLIFASKLASCSNLIRTALMLFEMTLMQFDAHELSSAGAFLGPFCFSLFIFIAVFVCMSMFLTIINESFQTTRNNIKLNQQQNEHIFSFMLHKLRQWIGVSERDEEIRVKYFHPIENFPDKIDQLFEALNRIYMNQ